MKPVRFHPLVQRDIDQAMRHYGDISELLEKSFWNEVLAALSQIEGRPERFHEDQFTGYKRCNLKRFPYHFLYVIYPDRIRIQVLRHDRRKETFGIYRKQ